MPTGRIERKCERTPSATLPTLTRRLRPVLSTAAIRGRPVGKATVALTVLALVAVLGLTLYPEAAPSSAVGCTAGLPYLSPTAVESIANVLLFVPVSFLVGIRWARPLLAITSGVALSAVIEAVQALVVGIGRACDTGDWVTNSIGAVIGGMLALAALALAQRRARAAA